MLTDYEIRNKLIKQLHIKCDGTRYRVIEELAICDGLARTDVVLANGVMHGFEIKSDVDTLERLPNQIECYDKTFDKVTIVVGKKFITKIQDIVPNHWGIEYAYINRFGNITLKRIRSSKINRNVNANNLLDLLWNQEIKLLLKTNKIKGYSTKDKTALKQLTIQEVPFKTLKDFTRETLKTRTGWRADLP